MPYSSKPNRSKWSSDGKPIPARSSLCSLQTGEQLNPLGYLTSPGLRCRLWYQLTWTCHLTILNFLCLGCKMGILSKFPQSSFDVYNWEYLLAIAMATSQWPHLSCGSLWNISLQGRDVALPFKGFWFTFLWWLWFSYRGFPVLCALVHSSASIHWVFPVSKTKICLFETCRGRSPTMTIEILQAFSTRALVIIRGLIVVLTTVSTLNIGSTQISSPAPCGEPQCQPYMAQFASVMFYRGPALTPYSLLNINKAWLKTKGQALIRRTSVIKFQYLPNPGSRAFLDIAPLFRLLLPLWVISSFPKTIPSLVLYHSSEEEWGLISVILPEHKPMTVRPTETNGRKAGGE